MKLDADFRDILFNNLRLNKDILEEGTLQLLSESISSPFRTILVNTSSKYGPFEIDYDSSYKCIRDTINSERNPQIRLRTISEDYLVSNEIVFDLMRPPFPLWTSPNEREFRNSHEKLNNKCEEEFWEKKENKKTYKNLSRFHPFKNGLIIPTKYLQSYNAFKYNIEGWMTYFTDLIKFYFPQFDEYNETNDKTIRFSKKITPDLSLGIEFFKDYSSKVLKMGEPDIAYLNIILFNNSFNPTLKTRPYITAYREDILSLGILGNPFFYKPCYSLSSYSIVEMYRLVEEEDRMKDPYMPAMEARHFWKKKIHKDGTFTLIHPKDYGEKLQRHACFYMAALAYSSAPYLDYIEKSVLDSISRVPSPWFVS